MLYFAAAFLISCAVCDQIHSHTMVMMMIVEMDVERSSLKPFHAQLLVECYNVVILMMSNLDWSTAEVLTWRTDQVMSSTVLGQVPALKEKVV